MPVASTGRSEVAASASGALGDAFVPGGGRGNLVDKPPIDRAPAAHAFLGGAKEIGAVAAHLALVGEAGEAAGAGQHREQRQLGQ